MRSFGRARLPLAVLAVLLGMDRGHAQVRSGAIDPIPAPLAAGNPAVAQPPAPASDELIVDVVVNEQPLADPQVIRRSGDTLWLSRETLDLARIPAPVDGAGGAWFALSTMPGVHHALDEATMRLVLDVAPDAFVPTRLQLDQPLPTDRQGDVAHAPLAAVLGYDLAGGRDGSGRTWSSLYVDAALSAGRASCSSRHLLRTEGGAARLDSNCIVDWPEHRLSLTVGDAIGTPWALSGSVRYGGFRIGTDFALQPDVATQPMLAIEGSARLPSVLELWLDQQRLMQRDLAPGRFSLEGIPPVAGSGDLRAVVRDATGRQTSFTVPFYSDPVLLRPGLSDWSLEAGRPRIGYLTRRDGYGGDPFAVLTWRQGLTAFWTSEVRAEVQQDRQVLGVANHLRLGRFGVVELAVAESRANQAVVRSHAIGYSFRGRRWSLGVRDQRRDDRWSDVAYPVPGLAPRRDSQIDAGLHLGRVLFTAGGVLRETREGERQRYVRAGINLPVGRGYLTLSGFASRGNYARDRTYSTMYTLPLSTSTSVSTWADRLAATVRPGVSLQRSAPAGLGYGYRAAHQEDAFGGRTVLEASYAAATYRLDGNLTQAGHSTDARAGVSGALVATRDGVFRAQDRSDNFAIVHLPDANTRIYRDHQLAAVTDARGLAIVPNLRAFQANELDVETDDLSLSTRIDHPSIALVPGRRQVLRADFAAASVRPLTLRLRKTDGGTIPAGAVATLPDDATAPVGHDGLLYLELTRPVDAITVSWVGAQCRVAVGALGSARDASTIIDAPCE